MADNLNKDAENQLTLESAMDKLGAAKPHLRPRFMKDGRIRAGIGSYQLARDKDGNDVLLFAMIPSQLRELMSNKSGEIDLEEDQKVYVVRAARAANREWIYAAVMNHQFELGNYCMRNTTLYQTDDYTWQSGPMAYRLYPNDEPKKNKAGETLYRLRLFSETEDQDNFTEVENEAPRGFVNNALSLGLDASDGVMTRAEAEALIAADFTQRVVRLREGLDPISDEEKRAKIGWVGARNRQRFLRYWKETSFTKKMSDAFFGLGKAASKTWEFVASFGIKPVVDFLLDGGSKGADMMLAEKAARNAIEKNTAGYGLLPEKGLPPCGEIMVPLDPVKAKKLKLLDEKSAQARPDDEPLYTDTPRDWAEDWIMMGLFGPSGSLVRFHKKKDSITIERSNGIALDVMPHSNESFARRLPELVQNGARNLPSAVEEALPFGTVLHLKLEKGDVTVQEISEEDYCKQRKKHCGTFRFRTPSGGHPVSNCDKSDRQRFIEARDRLNSRRTTETKQTRPNKSRKSEESMKAKPVKAKKQTSKKTTETTPNPR